MEGNVQSREKNRVRRVVLSEIQARDETYHAMPRATLSRSLRVDDRTRSTLEKVSRCRAAVSEERRLTSRNSLAISRVGCVTLAEKLRSSGENEAILLYTCRVVSSRMVRQHLETRTEDVEGDWDKVA